MIKRRFSIGFIRPDEREHDIVYVQMQASKDGNSVHIDAVSHTLFKYRSGSSGYEIGAEVKGLTTRKFNFVNDLLDLNNGKVVEKRFEEEGLELSKKLANYVSKESFVDKIKRLTGRD